MWISFFVFGDLLARAGCIIHIVLLFCAWAVTHLMFDKCQGAQKCCCQKKSHDSRWIDTINPTTTHTDLDTHMHIQKTTHNKWQPTKLDNKLNNNSVNKNGKRSNNTAILCMSQCILGRRQMEQNQYFFQHFKVHFTTAVLVGKT